MSRDEFIAANKHYHKRGMVVLLFPILLIIIVTAAYAPHLNGFQDYFDTKFTWAVSAILAIAPIAVPAVAALLVVIPVFRRIEKNVGLTCPHCHKSVIRFQGIIIATRNCPLCGMKVLDETPQNYG
jgi:hypothetical protein